MRSFLLSLIIVQSVFITAQTPSFAWVRSAGSATSDIGNAIAIDGSNNVLTTGYFNSTVDFDPGAGTSNLVSAGGNDIFVSKINTSGNFVWAVRFGGSTSDIGNGIATDAAGNVYVTGSFSGNADFDPGAGTSTMSSFGQNDIFVVKLDPSGNLVWAKQMGGSGNDEARSITVDGSGNVHTTGYFSSSADFDPGVASNTLTSSGSFDIFISKLNSSGNYVWAKSVGGTGTDIGNSIALDASGNVYTTGHFLNTADFDPGVTSFSLTSLGSGDIFINKLDASGNFSWTKQMGGTGNDVGNGIAIDASGNVYSGGYFFNTVDFDPGVSTATLTSIGAGDIFVSKLNSSGNYVWAKNMGSTLDDFAHALAIDATGAVYTTGYFADTADFDPGVTSYTLSSFFPGNLSLVRDQSFVSKLDASGNFVWAGALGAIKGYGIAATTTEVYTTGFFTSTTDFDFTGSIVNLTTVGSDDIYQHKITQNSVGMAENLNPSFTKLFPNPTCGNYCISTTEIMETIIVTDILGNEVLKIIPTTEKINIDMSNHVEGIYFVRSIKGNKQTVNKILLFR